MDIHRRRSEGRHDEVATEETRGKRPDYYLQNFHFQSGGWLGPLVRDAVFTPMSKAPGGRQIAARVLTGTLRLGRTPKALRP